VNPEDVQKAAGSAIQSRPDFTREMAQAIRGADADLARLALWSFQFYPVSPISVAPDVDFFGQQLVVSLNAFTQLPEDDPNRGTIASEISQRFSDWMVATRALQGQGNVSFVPVLQEIAILARKGAGDHNIRLTVLRVASFYLHKWGGIEPLPGDPPPR
jgi:hypothetical protein